MNRMLDVLLLKQLPVVTFKILYASLARFVFTLLYICCGFQIYAITAWPCCLLAVIVSAAFYLKPTLYVAYLFCSIPGPSITQASNFPTTHGPAGFPSSSHKYLAQMC